MRDEERRRLQGSRLAAARMAAGFRSAREAALSNGWIESSYRSHENGTRTVGQNDAEKYARAYNALGAQTDAQWILFGSARDQAAAKTINDEDDIDGAIAGAPRDPEPRTLGQFVEAEYGGTLQAGSFREVDDVDPQREPEIMPRDRRFPREKYVFFDVVGDSMNAADPPIPAGSQVLAVATDNPYRPIALRTGDIVVVQRKRAQGGLVERSVKELEMGDDETRYLPRSTNPRHQPIVARNDPDAEDETTVEVLALVLKVMADVKRG